MKPDIASRLLAGTASRPRPVTDAEIKNLLEQSGIPAAMAADIASRLTTETSSRPPRFGSADAVDYLYEKHGVATTEATLKTWAWRGGGPAFQKCGPRRLYPIEQLDAWAKQRLTPVVASTSQLTSLLMIGCDPAQALVQEPAPVVGVGKAKQVPARSTPPPRRRKAASTTEAIAE
jgi:hypothetical protein